MSTQNAIQLATAIQSKVGSSLISAQNLLPRDEAAGVMTQAGASSLGVFLLRDLHEMQRRTFMCVEKVSEILQSQLDLATEKDRRERDQAAELAKEKNKPKGFIGPPAPGGAGAINENLEDIEESINKGRMSELITGGLTAALLAPQALKSIGKGLGKRLLKGGMYAAIAGFVSEPIIKFVNEEFDLELTDDAKKDIEFGMIGAAAGFGLAGIPGAIIGATAPMIAKVGSYISGTLNADEISDKNFAGTAIGGAAAAMFATGKVGAYIKAGGMASLGAKASFGAALMSLPVIIGVGAGVALGVGVMYIAKKVDEYQEQILDRLADTVADLDKEMGEFAAKQEEGLFERMGINLGRVSALGEAKIAAQEASEQLGQNKERFLADTQTQTTLNALANAMLGYSDDAISTILQDGSKANNFLDTVENLKSIAAKGGFGNESKNVFEAMSAFSDRVQNVAIKMVDEGITGGKVRAVANNLEGIGGDQLEKLEGRKEERELKEKDIEDFKLLIESEKARLKKMADEGQGYDNILGFYSNDFERLDRDIGKMEKELESKIKRLDNFDAKTDKFTTTNGLLYNLDELNELYKDDKGRLQAIIERSINQSGSAFIQAQGNTTDGSGAVVINNINNSTSSQENNASMKSFVGKLDTTSDYFFSREVYNFGAI